MKYSYVLCAAFFLCYLVFVSELHPLLNNRAKDKQQSGGKKAAGRPRTDERKRTK
jgi:hypothetical protein